ncbi:hypothetical protein ABIA51_001161 [Erwinia aphidicola]
MKDITNIKKFIKKWLNNSIYFFLIFTGGDYLIKNLNLEHATNLASIILCCLIAGLIFNISPFNKKGFDHEDSYQCSMSYG